MFAPACCALGVMGLWSFSGSARFRGGWRVPQPAAVLPVKILVTQFGHEDGGDFGLSSSRKGLSAQKPKVQQRCGGLRAEASH